MALNVLFEHYKEPGYCSGSQVTISVVHAGYPATGLPLPVSSVFHLFHRSIIDTEGTFSLLGSQGGEALAAAE